VPENDQTQFSVFALKLSRTPMSPKSGKFGSKARGEYDVVEEKCREWDGAMVFGSYGAELAIAELISCTSFSLPW
jgi:hypothetical protein